MPRGPSCHDHPGRSWLEGRLSIRPTVAMLPPRGPLGTLQVLGLVLKLTWVSQAGGGVRNPPAHAGADPKGLITAGTTWEALAPANFGRRNPPGIIKGPKMSKLLVSEKQRLRPHGSSEQKPDWRLAANHTAKLGAEPRAATLTESVSE